MPTMTADVPPPPDAKSGSELRAVFCLCLLCLLLSAVALFLLGE